MTEGMDAPGARGSLRRAAAWWPILAVVIVVIVAGSLLQRWLLTPHCEDFIVALRRADWKLAAEIAGHQDFNVDDACMSRDLDLAVDIGGPVLMTPLAAACLAEADEVVDILLARGADAALKIGHGTAAIHVAAGVGVEPLFDLVFRGGPDPVVGRLETLLAAELLRYAMHGRNPDIVRSLADHLPHVTADDVGQAIATGAVHSTADCLRVLAERWPELVRERIAETSHLHMAATADIALALIELGDSPDEIDARGYTPLISLAIQGHTGAAAALVALGCDVDARGPGGWSALMHSIWRGNHDVASLLTQAGASEDGADIARLFASVKAWDVDACEDVLSRLGSADHQDPHGRWLIQYAVARDDPTLARLLVGHGADPRKQDRSGRSALSEAIALRNLQVTLYLQSMAREE